MQRLGAERYAEVLARYRGLMREAVSARDGVEVRTEGDGYYAAFASARQA